MKKYKLLKLLGGTLFFLTLVFFITTIHRFMDKQFNITNFFISILAIWVPILITFLTYIFKLPQKNTMIEPKMTDRHFVDRDSEYEQLYKLLQECSNRIIYIRGQCGMGKSLFIKIVCDRINYIDKKRWKKYCAYYYSHNSRQKVETGIANKFCNNANASIQEISIALNKFSCKSTILFIDNITELERPEAEEFAEALACCNDNNKIIISVDSNEQDYHISPGKFGVNEITALVKSYNATISEFDRNKLSNISHGYPVYARYNVEAFIKNIDAFEYYQLEVYIEKLISSMTLLEKEALALIICVTDLKSDGITCENIEGLDSRITKPILNKLCTRSFIFIEKGVICTEKLIAQKCLDFLSEYKNESYEKIYRYYKNDFEYYYLAVMAALKSNLKFNSDFLIEKMHTMYENHYFYLFIHLGNLELFKTINPEIRESKNCLFYLRYFYLKSLLELGLYNTARASIDSYDQQYQESISIGEISNVDEFEYQYMLIDLDHLTNQFENALACLIPLCQKAKTQKQIAQCRYLQAHCIRHMGKNLDEAYNIFYNLASDDNYHDDKILLRAIYSAISIKIFQGDSDYDYKNNFARIEQILKSNKRNQIWIPFINRHKAIYMFKIKQDIDKAIQILLDTISLLEVTSLRIKYDIYFELGEMYRILEVNEYNYNKSLAYYEKAQEFAKDSDDYNLFSNSTMGIILLSMKYHKNFSRESLFDIIEKSRELNLNINYNSALFIKSIIDNEMSEDLIMYWRCMKYSDLFSLSQRDKSERYNLKLTVM